MELEGGQILDWNGNPAQDQRGCGIRASHAIHDARWTGLEIRSHEGRIFAETANTAGETRTWLGEDGTAVSEAVSRLDAAGILSHLQNQYAGQSCNLSEVIRRIAESAGRSETIVHTDPLGGPVGHPGPIAHARHLRCGSVTVPRRLPICAWAAAPESQSASANVNVMPWRR